MRELYFSLFISLLYATVVKTTTALIL